MKTISFTFLLFLCISQASTAIVVSDEFRTYNSIEVRNSAIVYISEGTETNGRIEQTEGVPLPNVSMIVNKNKVLIIDSEEKAKNEKPPVIYITIKDLKKVTITGSGSIIMLNEITSKELEINNSGSGNILANINSVSVKIKISGSGDVDIKGKAKSTEIKITGSGNLNAKNLATAACSIVSSGSGSGTIDVSDELTATLTGSGNIYIVSTPDKVYSKSTGIGVVEFLKT